MFDVTKIQDGLVGLVGIRQPYNPNFPLIDATNLLSRSGRFLDDVPQYKTEYFYHTQDYDGITVDDFNDMLRDIQKASIASVCSSVFGDESYIDRNYIFSKASTRQDQETTIPNGFVGYRITPSAKKNLAFKITNVRLEFAGTGNVKLLLFNSNKNAPIEEETIAITDNDQVATLNWTVDSTNGDYKGDYYFGYIYDGTLVPFKRDYEHSNVMNHISELDIEEVYSEGAVDTTIFDLDDVFGLSENTGLNPDITVYKDYTDLILQNEHLLAHAIQLQWAINIMQRYVTSLRSNKDERLTKEVVAMTIQQMEGSAFNSPIKVRGLHEILAGEIASLRKVFQELIDGYFTTGIGVITAI